MAVMVQFERNAYGKYQYKLTIADGTDKQQLRDLMNVSTDLDKTITAEIEKRMKIMERQKEEKAAKKKTKTAVPA